MPNPKSIYKLDFPIGFVRTNCLSLDIWKPELSENQKCDSSVFGHLIAHQDHFLDF